MSYVLLSSLFSTVLLALTYFQSFVGLSQFSSDFPDITALSEKPPTFAKINGHQRNFSLASDSSEQGEESIVMKSNLAKHSRKISQTSIGSNISDHMTPSVPNTSHILVKHEDSFEDLNVTNSQLSSTSDLYGMVDPSGDANNKKRSKRNIALEAVICSCQICSMCEKAIYDEEVMGAWSADDSNLNIV